MNVESLSKVDILSNTFHYSAVTCDVLQPIDLIFWKDNTNCIWFFVFQIFFKVGKFATFSEHPKAKSFSASGGSWAPWLLTRSDHGLYPWTPLGAPPHTPYYRSLTFAFGGPPALMPALCVAWHWQSTLVCQAWSFICADQRTVRASHTYLWSFSHSLCNICTHCLITESLILIEIDLYQLLSSLRGSQDRIVLNVEQPKMTISLASRAVDIWSLA